MCFIRCWFSLAICFLSTIGASAATINYNTIISAENSFPGETVVIEDGLVPPTVVQMIEGGEASSILVSDTSEFNLLGGNITSSIAARGHSQVNILGGSVQSFSVRDYATVNMLGGVVESQINMLGGSLNGVPILNIYDGLIDADIYVGAATAVVNLFGGSSGLVFVHGGPINLAGGSVLAIDVYGSSNVYWSGGEMRERASLLRDDSILHIYGRNLTYDADGSQHLRGILLDGTVVDGYEIHTVDNSQVILHNVPEPATLTLAALGGAFWLFLATRRSHSSISCDRCTSSNILKGFSACHKRCP